MRHPEHYLYILLAVIACWYLRSLFKAILYRQTVFQYQTCLLFRDGRLVKALPAGSHWLWRISDTVQTVDNRTNTVTIGAQEVLTQDNVGLKISLSARLKITDAVKSIENCANWYTETYSLIQLAARDVIASCPAGELLSRRALLGKDLLERVRTPAVQFGVTIDQVDIKDIMFPAEMRKIFNEVVRAQKEGQAALERARGEQAALRSLANAARMLEGNPALMNLRILQALSGSCGGSVPSVVLGMPQGLFPLRPQEPMATPAAPGQPSDA